MTRHEARELILAVGLTVRATDPRVEEALAVLAASPAAADREFLGRLDVELGLAPGPLPECADLRAVADLLVDLSEAERRAQFPEQAAHLDVCLDGCHEWLAELRVQAAGPRWAGLLERLRAALGAAADWAVALGRGLALQPRPIPGVVTAVAAGRREITVSEGIELAIHHAVPSDGPAVVMVEAVRESFEAAFVRVGEEPAWQTLDAGAAELLRAELGEGDGWELVLMIRRPGEDGPVLCYPVALELPDDGSPRP
jgi:hypothetical protein